MKKLIVTMWTSLDNYIADSNGEMGWLRADEQMSDYEIGFVSEADTLMLGRNTYQDFSGYWPTVSDNPEAPEWEKTYASGINALHKIVVSSTLETADWEGTEIVRDIVPAAVDKLKQESGKNIIMYGSASVVRQLTKLRLIDEFQFLVHPVVLGSGKPLFDEKIDLELVSSEAFGSGVLLNTYRPA